MSTELSRERDELLAMLIEVRNTAHGRARSVNGPMAEFVITPVLYRRLSALCRETLTKHGLPVNS